jgi:glucose/arabinose dehydrogenase
MSERQSWWLRFKKSPAHTQVNIVCTAIIAIATVFYTFVAGFQLIVMRGTLSEMKRSGEESTQQMWSAINNINWLARSADWSQKTTEKANEDTHNQLVATQAAIFRLEPSYSQGSSSPISGRTEIPSIEVRVANDGKSAARKISGQVEYVHRDKAGRIIQSDRRPLADDTMYGNGSAFFKQFIITPTRASLMDYASDTFKVTVTITYDDGYNNIRTQHFCTEMAVTQNRAAFVECGEANAWKRTVR